MNCTLCPVKCGADREKRAGACGTRGITVAKYYLHPYEEPCLSPGGKSGAVFFGGCNLRCIFCQNYEVSRARRGKAVTYRELADIFRELEDMGAENLDLVTPDHISPLLAEALALYRPKVPVIYNSSGYAEVNALKEVAPFVDVWLPDLKFVSPVLSERYTGRRDYFEVASKALSFMAEKPVVWEGGRLLSGILVRHLVLPACTADGKRALDFLRGILPPAAPLSLMRQYVPMGEAGKFPELDRRVTDREYDRLLDYAVSLGFTNVFAQDRESAEESFVPQWDL